MLKPVHDNTYECDKCHTQVTCEFPLSPDPYSDEYICPNCKDRPNQDYKTIDILSKYLNT